MATYTENYQLHQWVPEDDFLRTDFNTDFQKIDAALGAKAEAAALTGLQEELDSVQKTAERRCRLISGSYAGSGSLPRDINIGVAPRALLLSLGNNTVTAIKDGGTVTQVSVTPKGFHLDDGPAWINQSGTNYVYLVLA